MMDENIQKKGWKKNKLRQYVFTDFTYSLPEVV